MAPLIHSNSKPRKGLQCQWARVSRNQMKQRVPVVTRATRQILGDDKIPSSSSVSRHQVSHEGVSCGTFERHCCFSFFYQLSDIFCSTGTSVFVYFRVRNCLLGKPIFENCCSSKSKWLSLAGTEYEKKLMFVLPLEIRNYYFKVA